MGFLLCGFPRCRRAMGRFWRIWRWWARIRLFLGMAGRTGRRSVGFRRVLVTLTGIDPAAPIHLGKPAGLLPGVAIENAGR